MKITTRYVEVHIIRRVEKNKFEFLLLKRSPEFDYPNLWQMITGKIESGEKAYETAVREVREETSLVIKALWSVPNINSFYLTESDSIILIPVFVGIVNANVKITLSEEHIEYRWVPASEAKKMLAWPGQKQSVELIEKYLNDSNLSALMKIEL